MKNRCWTSDRLARRGLPHQAVCPLCDQDQESIDHILVSCVFARPVWHLIMEAWGKLDWIPTQNDALLPWSTSLLAQARDMKDLHTLHLLVVWQLWKHRNVVVFDGARPSVREVIGRICCEGRSWSEARLLRGDAACVLVEVSRQVSSE